MTTPPSPRHDSQRAPASEEPVILHAWRVRLCARGLREAHERIQRAAVTGGLTFRQALSIARSMDAAVATLERTAAGLDTDSELRALANAALAAFSAWRVAKPRTEQSTTAALDLGAKVYALEALATRASTPHAKSATPENKAVPERSPDAEQAPPEAPQASEPDASQTTVSPEMAAPETQATVADVAAKSNSSSADSASAKLKSSPFASLEALRNDVPEGPAPTESGSIEREEKASGDNPYGGKIVITRTRKGRGGKTVTVIAGIVADAKHRDEIARDLRQALGCGVKAQGNDIVVQGAQEARVREFFEARGAKRIVIGT